MRDERYPIGQFQCPEEISEEYVAGWIEDIRLLPRQLAEVLSGVSEQSLGKTYRENS